MGAFDKLPKIEPKMGQEEKANTGADFYKAKLEAWGTGVDKRKKLDERNMEICRRAKHKSFATLAVDYGLSRQRVEQIVLRDAPSILAAKAIDHVRRTRDICDAIASGVSRKELQKKYGITQGYISTLWTNGSTEENIRQYTLLRSEKRLGRATKTNDTQAMVQRAAHGLLRDLAKAQGLSQPELARKLLGEE